MAEGKILKDKSVVKKLKPVSELTFATIGRVSEPSQFIKGKSEPFQKAKIKNAIDSLGAKWHEEYYIGGGGSQHATEGWNREDFEQIEKWALAGKIDAVMVAEFDRWSRDPIVSNKMLEFMRQHKIRYFELHNESNLFDVYEKLRMTMQAAFGGFQAENQCKKSYAVKLNTALKKGEFTGGTVLYPYVRNPDPNGFDYIVDEKTERYKNWKQIRKLYKNNENNIDQLAKMFSLSSATISNILLNTTYHTGKRVIKFKNSKEVQIEDKVYESVDMPVEVGGFQIIANKKEYDEIIAVYNGHVGAHRRPAKYKYLLARRIKCGHCGMWMSGYPQKYKDKVTLMYYCPTAGSGCGFRVQAKPLEEAFLREFEHICYDPEKLENAIGAKGQRFRDIQETKTILNERLSAIDREIKGVANGIQKSNNNELIIDELLKKADKLNDESKDIKKQMNELNEEEANLPNLNELKRLMNTRLPAIEKEIKKSNGLAGYSFEDKKRLLDYIFPPQNPKNRQYGVIVWKSKDGHFSFKAEGIMDQLLIGELHKIKDGWEIKGGNSNSSFRLYTQQWDKTSTLASSRYVASCPLIHFLIPLVLGRKFSLQPNGIIAGKPLLFMHEICHEHLNGTSTRKSLSYRKGNKLSAKAGNGHFDA